MPEMPLATSRDQYMGESIMKASKLLDPLAGNSVITTLNASMRTDAREQIDMALAESLRLRSRLRRKRELAGETELEQEKQEKEFNLKGVLEKLADKSERTETETIANSDIYNMLEDEMDFFNQQY
jgi:hypothetical protein